MNSFRSGLIALLLLAGSALALPIPLTAGPHGPRGHQQSGRHDEQQPAVEVEHAEG